MDAFKQQLEQLSEQNQYRSNSRFSSSRTIYYARKIAKMLNMSSNDYLGLASNEKLAPVFFTAIWR